jgi:hypothetical protein
VAAVVLIFRAAATTSMRSLRTVLIALGILTAIVLTWSTVAMFMR